jgi:hypothetical protein
MIDEVVIGMRSTNEALDKKQCTVIYVPCCTLSR